MVGFSMISRDLSPSSASEARYRGLLEAAPDAMVVVNQAGEIVLLNVQAEKQFGYHRDELLGQPVTNIIPEGLRGADRSPTICARPRTRWPKRSARGSSSPRAARTAPSSRSS